MNQDFSITFWIEVEKNPSWTDKDSIINFPPFQTKDWIKVFFSKCWVDLKVNILHPNLWCRKVVANIEKYIWVDAFIALTNSKNDTKLYVNAENLYSAKRKDLLDNLEKDDYVLIEITDEELDGLKIQDWVSVAIPAKIKSIDNDEIVLDFFENNQVKKMWKDKVFY